MAFIPTPGGLKFVVHGATDRAPVVNVLHATHTQDDPASSMDGWAQALYDIWEVAVLPLLSTAYRLISVECIDLSAQDGAYGSYAESGSATGGATGQAGPYDSALVMTLRTASRGRSARGRLYLGPISEDYMVAGEIGTDAATAFVEAMAEVKTAMGEAGAPLAIISFVENKQPREFGAIYPVTSIMLRSRIVGSQKRRAARP